MEGNKELVDIGKSHDNGYFGGIFVKGVGIECFVVIGDSTGIFGGYL